MAICLGAGGEPVSFTELVKKPEMDLQPNSTVWTGEYIELELVKSIPDDEAATIYDCGFTTLKINPDYDNVYSPSKLQYTNCSEVKNYFCKSAGFTLKDKTFAACGTNMNKTSRDDPNNCEDELQAVCKFANSSMVSANFTKSCFQESKQEATTVQTKHLTEGGLPVTEVQNNTVTIKTTQDSLLESRTFVIIVIAMSVVIFCGLAGIFLFTLGRKSRKGKFEKQAIVENSRQNFSTTDISGVHRNTYSNDVNTTNDGDSEYYNVCNNENPETIEGSHYDTYAVTETDYGDVYSVPSKEKQPHTLTTNETIVEKEYDTTKAIKTFNDSKNIYNKLGFNNIESVYDNNEDSDDKKPPQFTDDTYSTTRARKARDTYNTLNTTWNQGKSNSNLRRGINVNNNASSSLTNKENVYYNGYISRAGNDSIEMNTYDSTVNCRRIHTK